MLNRRHFLSVWQRLKSPKMLQMQTSLEPQIGVLTSQQLIHLLKRTMFGATKADINYFSGKTAQQVIAELVNGSIPATTPPINTYSYINPNGGTNGFQDPNVPLGNVWVDMPIYFNPTTNSIESERPRMSSLRGWWLENMRLQSRHIHEKMVLFWHNHIPIQFRDINIASESYYYLTLLRQHALGNFKTLMREITTNSAMLRYLNGEDNRKSAPDENYARELQELFCIGKSPQAGYTESDVQAAARVLTGWRRDSALTNNPPNAQSGYFSLSRHDTTNKAFSNYYDNTVIMGNNDGASEVDDLIDMIFARPETAQLVCRKLYRFFVCAYHADNSDGNAELLPSIIEQEIITPLANIFRNANYEIMPVLETLFQSQHFFDCAQQGGMLKSPIDFVVGFLREGNLAMPQPPDYNAVHKVRRFFAETLLPTMGQAIGDPPNVAGWAAYYQSPSFDREWLSSDILVNQNKIISQIVSANGYVTGGFSIKFNVIAFTQTLNNPADANDLIAEVLALLFAVPLQDNIAVDLKSILLNEQASEYYWTSAWNTYLSTPTTANANVVINRLLPFYTYIFNLSEYRLM